VPRCPPTVPLDCMFHRSEARDPTELAEVLARAFPALGPEKFHIYSTMLPMVARRFRVFHMRRRANGFWRKPLREKL